jgi:hypothetical protein
MAKNNLTNDPSLSADLNHRYYTDEERKRAWTYHATFYTFITKYDLSGGVIVKQDISDPRNTIDAVIKSKPEFLVRDVAEFIANFMLWHHPHLNGFSGMDTIKWTIED